MNLVNLVFRDFFFEFAGKSADSFEDDCQDQAKSQIILNFCERKLEAFEIEFRLIHFADPFL